MPTAYKSRSSKSTLYSKGCYFGEESNHISGSYKITSGSRHFPPCAYGVLEDNDTEMAYGGIFEIDNNILKMNPTGTYINVSPQLLSNKSVAFYFSSYENAKCRSFTPFLVQFYKSINSSAAQDKIEIILVSLDKDEERFKNHMKHMPWAFVDYNSDLRKHLIKRYQVREDPEYQNDGSVPVTGLPKLVVIGRNGEKLHWISCDNNSQTILREWDFHATKWP